MVEDKEVVEERQKVRTYIGKLYYARLSAWRIEIIKITTKLRGLERFMREIEQKHVLSLSDATIISRIIVGVQSVIRILEGVEEWLKLLESE